MKNKLILTGGLLLALVLAACGGSDAVEITANGAPVENPPTTENAGATIAVEEGVPLSGDYEDALSIQAQLAVGTLQLEGTEQAVDEMLAADLLPLWRAVQSLRNSETAAEAEVTAVLNQIQKTMTPEQISAIAAKQLTNDSLTALIEEGTLVLGRGGAGSRSGESAGGGNFAPPGGGLPDEGGPGRGQGGGIPGGLPAGASEDDIATRRAARAAGDVSGFQDRALTNAVILLLETKTGA